VEILAEKTPELVDTHLEAFAALSANLDDGERVFAARFARVTPMRRGSPGTAGLGSCRRGSSGARDRS